MPHLCLYQCNSNAKTAPCRSNPQVLDVNPSTVTVPKMLDKRMKWWWLYFKALWKQVMQSRIFTTLCFLRVREEREVILNLDRFFSPIGIKWEWTLADAEKHIEIKFCQFPITIMESPTPGPSLVTKSSIVLLLVRNKSVIQILSYEFVSYFSLYKSHTQKQ